MKQCTLGLAGLAVGLAVAALLFDVDLGQRLPHNNSSAQQTKHTSWILPPKDAPTEFFYSITKKQFTAQQGRSLAPNETELPPQVPEASWCQLEKPGVDCCRPPGGVGPGPRIWDSFTFNGDWELFELRLGTLSPWIDQFVVLQSNLTFGGKRRSFITPGDPRIAPWKNCIRLVTVLSEGTGSPVVVEVASASIPAVQRHPAGTWPKPQGRDDVEIWYRENTVFGFKPIEDPEASMMERSQTAGIRDDDFVIFSDLDEIPNPRVVVWLLERFNDQWFLLYFKEYTYGFWNERTNFLAPSAALISGKHVLKYKMSLIYLHGRRGGAKGDHCRGKSRKRRYAQRLLLNAPFTSETACTWYSENFHPRGVYNAGWHCSNCFPSVERIMRKLCAFGWMHELLQSRGYGDPATFLKVVREGRIVHSTSRKHMAAPFTRKHGNATAPAFALFHYPRFSFMLAPEYITLGNFSGCPKDIT